MKGKNNDSNRMIEKLDNLPLKTATKLAAVSCTKITQKQRKGADNTIGNFSPRKGWL